MKANDNTAPEPAEIARVALAHVVGGRLDHGPPTTDPNVVQGMQSIAQAVQGMGKSLADAKVANQQNAMQTMGQLMQSRGGH